MGASRVQPRSIHFCVAHQLKGRAYRPGQNIAESSCLSALNIQQTRKALLSTASSLRAFGLKVTPKVPGTAPAIAQAGVGLFDGFCWILFPAISRGIWRPSRWASTCPHRVTSTAHPAARQDQSKDTKPPGSRGGMGPADAAGTAASAPSWRLHQVVMQGDVDPQPPRVCLARVPWGRWWCY